MGENKAISLKELNLKIKSGVRDLFPLPYWIIGEISELNINQSGHCYLELIEKAEESEQITAKAKATIWAFTFRMLKPYFESVTGQRFTTGIKVMLSVNIEFHELYGFSLNVKDIEPNFTVGDLARKKQEIIKQLQDEGVLHLNKELDFPLVPQRIAIISSETAAGYGDFINQLKHNRYGYKFRTKLFNAFMQGAETEKSIIEALEKIFESVSIFDVVVIIRGGGSQSDLNYFNSYWLAYHITQFPIPVITGIGHERDQTITDLVAHNSLKTPTAVAEYIIEKTLEFDSYLAELQDSFIENVTEKLQELNENLQDLQQHYTSLIRLNLSNKNGHLEKLSALKNLIVKNKLIISRQKYEVLTRRIKPQIHHLLFFHKKELDTLVKKLTTDIKKLHGFQVHKIFEMESRANLLDPSHLLKKGYSLTYKDGVLIKSIQQLKQGDTLLSKLHDGVAESTVDNLSQEI